MKFLATLLPFLFLVISCEVPQYSIPSMNNEEVEEDESSEAETVPKASSNLNNSNFQNNGFSRMNSKQDSSKSYHENLKGIIHAKPKKPNPPEDPF